MKAAPHNLENTPKEVDLDEEYRDKLPDSVRLYLNQLPNIKLKAEDEVRLAREMEAGAYAERIDKVRNGGPEGAQAVLEELWDHYIPEKQWEGFDRDADSTVRDKVEGAFAAIQAIADNPQITNEGLAELVEAGRKAEHIMITANLPLVVSIVVRKYPKNDSRHLKMLDLIQEGNTGLMKAVRMFNWRKGVKFSTYATPWIREAATAAMAELEDAVRKPEYVYWPLVAVERVLYNLKATRPNPTDKEVADALAEQESDTNLDEARVAELRALLDQRPVSLDTPVGVDGETALVDFLAGLERRDDDKGSDTSNQRVRDILALLSPRDAQILEMRMNGATFEDIAKTITNPSTGRPLSRSRIQQVYPGIIKKLLEEPKVQEILQRPDEP